jgi:Polyketide cyclase / dehydrase and lipid transport
MLRGMSWHALKPADASAFVDAPIVHRFPVRLPVPPERVWESIASDRSMWDWDLGVKRLTWTSPRPFGVGTTREVVLPFGAMTVREQFFRWDEGKGYSFYVAETDRPIVEQFAEDYEIEPDGAGSVFTWTIALEPKRALLPVMRLAGPLNKMAFGQVPRAAKRYFTR